jgi:hypothetical protein
MFFSLAANAQDYKPFRVGIALGYAIPDGGGGILFDIEPSYRVSDQIAVGLRLESAAMARSIDGVTGSVSGNGSYTVNGQYYLGDGNFRPYVGLGMGIFTIASVSISAAAGEVAAGSKIGFYPRIGFDLGHFNVNLDYNIIGATAESITFDGNAIETDIKNSYIGLRFGAFIGGGKN